MEGIIWSYSQPKVLPVIPHSLYIVVGPVPKKKRGGRGPYVSFMRYLGGTGKCYIQCLASLPSK